MINIKEHKLSTNKSWQINPSLFDKKITEQANKALQRLYIWISIKQDDKYSHNIVAIEKNV